jgi:hypothetical protein
MVVDAIHQTSAYGTSAMPRSENGCGNTNIFDIAGSSKERNYIPQTCNFWEVS